MHELSIALQIVDVATAALAGGPSPEARVGRVLIRVGALSGVAPESLEFCYDLSVRGTALEGSQLAIELQPVVIHCPRCLRDSSLPDVVPLRCPECGSPVAELIHGRELELVSLELLDPDEPTPDGPDPRRVATAAPHHGGPAGDPEGA